MSYTKIYRVYMGIRQRCNNPNANGYNRYWGRWIKCEWKNFLSFYKDMSEWFQEWLEIEEDAWKYARQDAALQEALRKFPQKISNLLPKCS